MMRAMLPPGSIESCNPDPIWIFRHHSPAAVTSLDFVKRPNVAAPLSDGAESDAETDGDSASSSSAESTPGRSPRKTIPDLVAGDADGFVSLTSLQDRRPWLHWQAHSKGKSVLGVQAWIRWASSYDQSLHIVTHGRDNEIRVWELQLQEETIEMRSTGHSGGQSRAPRCVIVLPVNALNFCRFSLTLLSNEEAPGQRFLLAVPHSLDSGFIDVFLVQTSPNGGEAASTSKFTRLHAAVGKAHLRNRTSEGGCNRAPIVMSMHIIELRNRSLAIVAGYEDGLVRLWTYDGRDDDDPDEAPWKLCWEKRAHRESVFSTALITKSRPKSPTSWLLGTVGADDRIALLEFSHADTAGFTLPCVAIYPTSRQGRSSIAFSSQDTAIVGGWDGKARLYKLPASIAFSDDIEAETTDSKTLVCTAVFRYHKESIQSVGSTMFSVKSPVFIAVGGQEGRISLWSAQNVHKELTKLC